MYVVQNPAGSQASSCTRCWPIGARRDPRGKETAVPPKAAMPPGCIPSTTPSSGPAQAAISRPRSSGVADDRRAGHLVYLDLHLPNGRRRSRLVGQPRHELRLAAQGRRNPELVEAVWVEREHRGAATRADDRVYRCQWKRPGDHLLRYRLGAGEHHGGADRHGRSMRTAIRPPSARQVARTRPCSTWTPTRAC